MSTGDILHHSALIWIEPCYAWKYYNLLIKLIPVKRFDKCCEKIENYRNTCMQFFTRQICNCKENLKSIVVLAAHFGVKELRKV